MGNISNTSFVKRVLLLSVTAYMLVLTFGLIHNAGLRRFITIERTQQHGVVVIRNIKYPTPYRTDQARVAYTVTGPIEYLLLPSGMYQENLLSASLKLIIAVLFAIFVWKFDFSDPFQVIFLNRAYLIYRLYIGSLILGCLTSWYSSNWASHYFYKSDYHFYSNTGNLYDFLMLFVMLSVGMYLYTRAVKNKQEIDLTI